LIYFPIRVTAQEKDATSKNRIGSFVFAIGLSRPSGVFKTYKYQNETWRFQKNVYKSSLEFGYLLKFSLKKNSDVFSYPKKNPLLKTGLIISSRSSQLDNETNNLEINYSQNILILPIGILNSIKISDKNTKVYFEHGLGATLNFLLTESIDYTNGGSDKFVISPFSRGTFGAYLEAGFSTINEKKRRHTFSVKLLEELNPSFYRGNTKSSFNLRSFNLLVSYSLFEFIK
jgi:hypothetical protein